MQKLRGSPRIIVFLFYFLCLWSQATGMCPPQCKCNDTLLRVVCNSGGLDVVPITLNPGLKELFLNNNIIAAFRTSLNVYHNLEYLDVSSNVLDTLNEGNFKGLEHLKVLRLNRNKITLLPAETFQGLSSLKELYLDENFLEGLSSENFMHLQNLELLNLSQNKISYVDEKAFMGLKNLTTLLMRGNKLSVIPTASFQHISKIYKLDLGLNSFQNIPDDSFTSLKDLQELSLDGCEIQVIERDAFKWLISLLTLDIHDNKLSEIPTKALLNVIHLEKIRIGQNNFRDIKTKSFQRLASLHTIDISNCPSLELIGENAFSDNPSLKTIIINHNRVLRHFEEGAFDNLLNIKHVSLRANAFETFQFSLLPWNELNLLDVRDNPLVCNCSILWLWKLLVTKNYSSADGLSDTTQVVCINPPELKDSILPNLLEVDLDCYTLDTRRQIIIGIVLAGAVASAAIIMIGFRYRDKVAGVLKTKWGHGRKEPQYQKTNAEEESTILQAAQQSLKMTPVTEL